MNRASALFLGLVLAACAPSVTPAPTPTPLSDAALQAIVGSNIETSANSLGGGIGRKRDGTLDIAVRDRVLWVASAGIGTAQRLCDLVVAVTKDPATGRPLGIAKIIVVGPDSLERLAECVP